ncbi:MAG TPA: hypothetical protein VIQ24_14725 [Pyrinomonadaceae bacterium]
MADNTVTYVWSDAWLLLATLYASREGGATLEQVTAAGDYINHAIFTADELEGGLGRLAAGGFIREKQGLYSITGKVLKAHRKTTTPRRPVYRELEDMERWLKIRG